MTNKNVKKAKAIIDGRKERTMQATVKLVTPDMNVIENPRDTEGNIVADSMVSVKTINNVVYVPLHKITPEILRSAAECMEVVAEDCAKKDKECVLIIRQDKSEIGMAAGVNMPDTEYPKSATAWMSAWPQRM